MSLYVDISHRLGDFRVDAAFETSGRLTALFGKSGAGKTTIVNAIAGLIRPDRAKISVDGETFVDTEQGFFVPKHRRRVGYVFQEGRLFPHLTIRQNLLYGRWFSGNTRRATEIDEVVELLGIAHLLTRRPGDLSGGEKQRAAIGRALLADPRLLLMDEPLASLDDARKAEILPYIERLRDELKIPIVYVTHAVSEIARLATTVVLLSKGKVEKVGDVSDVLADPVMTSLDRADVGGVIMARVERHDAADDLTILRSKGGPLVVPKVDASVGAELRIHVRAKDVMLATERPTGLSALNILPAMVSNIGDTSGSVVDIALDLCGDRLVARITRRSFVRLELQPGRQVFAIIKSIAIERCDVGFVFNDKE